MSLSIGGAHAQPAEDLTWVLVLPEISIHAPNGCSGRQCVCTAEER
jgi:hypothetical protein